MEVIIISGDRGEGKTTFLKKYINELSEKFSDIYGFYAENRNGSDEYVIHNLNSNKKEILCKRNSPETGNLQIGDFRFDENSIKKGEIWIKKGFKADNPVFVIDEVGKFELDGLVWDNILKEIITLDKGVLVLTVRKNFLEAVIKKYETGNKAVIIHV